LIDELPESELAAAARFLRSLRTTADSVLRARLDVPLDEEPETAEEYRLVPEARDEPTQGQVRTLEEVRRELGLCAGRLS
jgi:hypothetical protein